MLEPLTETPVRGNVIMMLQMRRCGLHVMVVLCGGGRRDAQGVVMEVLYPRWRGRNVLLLSTCTVVMALLGVVALSLLCPNF